MSEILNFLDPEEYEEPSAQTPTAFGEPGYRKGESNPRKGTPRARITDADARILAFLGHFPAADAEALSLLNIAQSTNFGTTGGSITSVATTERRLAKLIKLGAVRKERQPATGIYSYGVEEKGFAAAREYGYDMDHARSLVGISYSRLTHYRMIALVAAQLASPAGFFRDSLGIEPVELEQLISENDMRAGYEPVRQLLKERKDKKLTHDFGAWREKKLADTLKMLNEGRLDWQDLIEAHPVLLTLGQPQKDGTRAKPVHQPDIAVNLDTNRENHWANSILIEVELSKKDRDEYTRILATLRAELDKPYIYRRAVYFTIGTQVEKILRQIDTDENFKLFESGKLTVLPLTHRDGSLVAQKKRITVGGN